jgi:hypothetical protein
MLEHLFQIVIAVVITVIVYFSVVFTDTLLTYVWAFIMYLLWRWLINVGPGIFSVYGRYQSQQFCESVVF